MVSGTLSVDALLDKMARETRALISHRSLDDPLMIGIRTGGVWLAERLHQQLELSSPLGVMDISFYRDDFTQAGINPKVQPTQLPCPTEGRHIILVDDVIMTGRTIRAALNELFDYGRPASVSLITLLDLQRRELPIQADVIGGTLALGPDQVVKLNGPDPLSLTIRQRD
ncbi:bifunctional pyr operon transcriptional regulator/uracil phosphoribosyltransferase PyrR [Marinobacterium sp. AK62]|uniref:Bifunctional pyr operon transcriptional regulator/uracil phosphoribosyltransferase PyrR n=1 Tax=Marinobacterium alkalitolerans TaxID=1542925 RepID=A0ABS3Z689_9GAMM|nr:bifunctional pyr operon transcriptional regulator/uracil phosphoribosyltransferase PyrR [Marinobacterium alkalitolerans]MBP0047226.1 bifunctional pyr operon transcriptional regulator/uracil phosphoribosyltransferase PyrR [Marinobacterium alkalitolerans]